MAREKRSHRLRVEAKILPDTDVWEQILAWCNSSARVLVHPTLADFEKSSNVIDR